MFTARRQLTSILSTVAALAMLLSSLFLVPVTAADSGTDYIGHLVKVSPRLALTKALSGTHFSCQDAPLDGSADIPKIRHD